MNGTESIFSGCLVTPLETIWYALLIGLLSLLHLNQSCLVNTFSFSFYWGLKEIMRSYSVFGRSEDSLLALYFVSGIVIFLVLNFYYWRSDTNRAVQWKGVKSLEVQS